MRLLKMEDSYAKGGGCAEAAGSVSMPVAGCEPRGDDKSAALAAAVFILKTKATHYERRLSRFSERVGYLETTLAEKDRLLAEKEAARARLLERFCAVTALAESSLACDVKAGVSVVVLVLNGGERLKRLLAKLGTQRKIGRLEVIIVDSGSTDGSLEVAKSHGVKLIQIPRASFSHGGARHLAIQHAAGEYVLYIVDDALPDSDYWLYKIVSTLDANPDISVLTIRQKANENADLYSRWVLHETYASYGISSDCKYFLEDPSLFWELPEQVRRRMSFVDDVCACYRKSALAKYGFKPVPNGEDVEIGVRMVCGGEHLGFLRSTTVLHWHSNGPDYFLKRHYNGVKTFSEILHGGHLCFEPLHIASLNDIVSRAWVLYHCVRLALAGWRTSGGVDVSAVHSFLRLFNEVIEEYPVKIRDASPDDCGAPGLRSLLESFGIPGTRKTENGGYFKHNHLLLNFSGDLRKLIDFCYRADGPREVSVGEFSDALFKIAASQIGSALGYWYIHLKEAGWHGSMSEIDKTLGRDICYR